MLKKKTLKKLVIAVVTILVLAVVMFVTKPSGESYNRWALDQVSGSHGQAHKGNGDSRHLYTAQ